MTCSDDIARMFSCIDNSVPVVDVRVDVDVRWKSGNTVGERQRHSRHYWSAQALLP